MLSVPRRLRYFLQRDGAAINTALRIDLRVVPQGLPLSRKTRFRKRASELAVWANGYDTCIQAVEFPVCGGRKERAVMDYPGRYWHMLDDGRIQCDLCPRDCRL